MLSWPVLIDRGFNHNLLIWLDQSYYLSFQGIISYIFIGDYDWDGTPVPIPNTEVKHFNGEDSVSENSKLLIFFL